MSCCISFGVVQLLLRVKLAAAVCSLDSVIALNNWFVLNAYVMHLVLPFITFIHMHFASHLGALDEPREGRDGGPIPKMEGLSKC